MSRPTRTVLALMFVLGIGLPARAQGPGDLPANGGFGFDYTQPVPSNRLMLDRWWMVEQTPAVGLPATAPVAVPQPSAVATANPVRVARGPRIGRSLARMSGRPYYRPGPTVTALPTGSLNGAMLPAVPLYTPEQRYAAYGQGYGVSPYGSVDYSAQYKGMYWAP